ncbi:MAG TPA: DUF86 domain-containing protein [Thermoanaerobaculia bacterium]
MVDRNVVMAKVSVIERCLERIAEVHGTRRTELRPLDVEDITLFNLQKAVQAAIDLATHVVAAEGYGTPDSQAAVFTLLEKRGVIPSGLAGNLRKMVGFRNIAVHEYETIDPAIVEAIVERHLGDLQALGNRIVEFFGIRER